ncbi:6-bladed beta-propeller [Maribellus maritimus]|uniref:6-bladed beta-propeller n=1 Tax=Maribellus maritimus TaxID=2870838 RepID=UPI001EEC502E|nr:6-bladed beta-propeller [Maribellus maritimus]MCG6189363.1 6-bladed beta-propeller [Maribellus maritimus]
MKQIIYLLFILLFFSCSPSEESENNVIHIDPTTFSEEEILLSEIADDIAYVPLANEFPIGFVYSYKITDDFIYAAIKDVGVMRFSKDGKLNKRYGKIGRGPGEYVYCLDFVLNPDNGMVYVMDHKMDDVEVYSKSGKHVRNFKLPGDEDGFGLSEIELFNSSLVFAQYLNMGRGDNDWIVLDTLGNRITEKKNPYPEFKGRIGSIGGLSKYAENLLYWDNFKDTVFSISLDFKSRAVCIFAPGEHRWPMTTEKYNPVDVFLNNQSKYLISHLFLDAGHFYVYEYFYDKKLRLAIIDKIKGEAKSIDLKNRKGGITNNIDNGLPFIPENYFEFGAEKYLVSIVQPYALKTRIESNAFKNSTSKFPEKKKELEELANRLDENDNLVLMLVKLKD